MIKKLMIALAIMVVAVPLLSASAEAGSCNRRRSRRNNCDISVSNRTEVKQISKNNVSNNISVSANTGGNWINNNTLGMGGKLKTKTGDVGIFVTVTNKNIGLNEISI